MKYIEKSREPARLSEYIKQYKKRYRRIPQYTEVDSDFRRGLRRDLIDEQFFICAYCMRSIAVDSSMIEHIKPRSKYPKESLNYMNLLACCNTSSTCGNSKGDWWDKKEFLSPLDPGCEKGVCAKITDRMLR
jgi:uncharacterized protein (TIGR02646 family)